MPISSVKVKLSYLPYTLIFKEPGGTSRGILKEKPTLLIRASQIGSPGIYGYGEAPVFPGLSIETRTELIKRLDRIVAAGVYEFSSDTFEMSSLQMGIETAVKDLVNGGNGLIFPSPFTSGDSEILINGLIWMGAFDKMKSRIEEKLEQGFHCIKIKIGAINWAEEISLIKFIRKKGGDDLIIRVDANGAFTPEEAFEKLCQLAQYNVHSIEQPIEKNNLSEMKRLCHSTPVPIALDEELIGIPPGNKRNEILEEIAPQYIILKPALCYGFIGAADWIERAEKYNVGWWITSALESSIGLNAIAQFTGLLAPDVPQGLGTGNLFTNNFKSPLNLKTDTLSYNKDFKSFNDELGKLNWIE